MGAGAAALLPANVSGTDRHEVASRDEVSSGAAGHLDGRAARYVIRGQRARLGSFRDHAND